MNCLSYRDDTVSTENLTTLFAVVPKSGKGEWLSTYEQISDFVVCPRRLARQPVLWDAASAVYPTQQPESGHSKSTRSHSIRTCPRGDCGNFSFCVQAARYCKPPCMLSKFCTLA